MTMHWYDNYLVKNPKQPNNYYIQFTGIIMMSGISTSEKKLSESFYDKYVQW